MPCTSLTITGRKCRKPVLLDDKCCVHHVEPCSICLENVLSINSKSSKRLNCGHSFHTNCIIRWYESSNECPTCRREQLDDPLIILKMATEERMRLLYVEAIRSLERQIPPQRRRRSVNLGE